jgi:aminoglycoside phosphotransferase (APT) family kinase protein
LAALSAKIAKGALTDAIHDLEEKTASFEGVARRYGPLSKQESFAKLNGALLQLLGAVDSADAAPTEAAQTTFAEVQRSLEGVTHQWEEVKAREIPALNERLRSANLPAIALTAAAPPSEEPPDSDEP